MHRQPSRSATLPETGEARLAVQIEAIRQQADAEDRAIARVQRRAWWAETFEFWLGRGLAGMVLLVPGVLLGQVALRVIAHGTLAAIGTGIACLIIALGFLDTARRVWAHHP